MESFLHSPTGTPWPYGPCVLVRPRQGVLRLHDPTEPKAPESCDPCTLFSTSPQSFWALRFNRTLSAHEPCGSRTSSPVLRSSVSTARPNWRVPGSCDPCALLRPLRKIFRLCDPADSRLPRPCGCCSLSHCAGSFLGFRLNLATQ